MKKLLLPLALTALAAPAAFASSGTGNITASVPGYCEILQVTDVHADFSAGATGYGSSGVIMVICNKDVGFSLSSPTPDASGRFFIEGVSGIAGSQMEIQMNDPVSGSRWTNNGYYVGGQGTGTMQQVPFELSFNPDGGVVPAYGNYAGTVTFDLVNSSGF